MDVIWMWIFLMNIFRKCDLHNVLGD